MRSNANWRSNPGMKSGLEWMLNTLKESTTDTAFLQPAAGPDSVTATIMHALVQYDPLLDTRRSLTFLARQVSLTDFCVPESERPGMPILILRHPLDIHSMSILSTPPGRNPTVLEEAWLRLSETASVSVQRSGENGVRASLISFSFLVASRAEEYPDRSGAEALRAHIIATYGSRRVSQRLDRFGEALTAMVRCHVHPHMVFNLLGGLLSYISQREIASVTAVSSGIQESYKTDKSSNPRSSVHIPACAFLDLDQELRISGDGVCFLYLVFVYTHRLGREGVRAYFIKSTLNDICIREGLGHVYGRLRTENTIRGMQGAVCAPATDNAIFPLLQLYSNINAPRCPRATLFAPRATDGLFNWVPDIRGYPTIDSCMYAAYRRVGIMTGDSPRAVKRTERYGSIDVPVIWLEGVNWTLGSPWRECYY